MVKRLLNSSSLRVRSISGWMGQGGEGVEVEKEEEEEEEEEEDP